MAASKQTRPWQGTDHIESRLVTAHNRLVSVILAETPLEMPEPWAGTKALPHAYDPDDAIKDIKSAVETYDWLASQKPPARERAWAESKLRWLARSIDRAQKELPKIVAAGRYAEAQAALAKDRVGKHPYGVRLGNLSYNVRADDPDEAVQKVKKHFTLRGISAPPGNVSVAEFEE
jgi:hypothetical protein